MKKVFTLFFACTFATASFAEGYQVNLQSAKQAGMGHVGASMKLGAESMHFNPAGLSFMTNRIDLSAGVSAIFANASYKNPTTNITEKTDNKVSTPLYVYAGFKIYDNLAAGISVTNPYGSGLNWGKNWSGADLIQDISLKAFSIQPTLSYKICDNLSIGAGLMIAFGDVEISRAMLPAGALTSLGLGAQFKDVIPASATLTGKSNVRFGYNVGAMYDINSKLTVGASFRSKVTMKVKEGTAKIDYASEAIKNILSQVPIFPQLDKGTFTAEMPLPANLNIGASYKLNSRLLLAAEIQTVFWKAYDKLDIIFSEEAIDPIKATKNYKNTLIYRIGAEYATTSRLDLRAGIYYDQSPIRKDMYNPETPGMDKIGISAGFSFRPITSLSVDFSFLYIQGLGRDGSYKYEVLNQPKVFAGHYKTNAFTPTIGLTYRY